MVILVGHVASAPSMRSTQKGQPVLNFTMAVNDEWRDPSGAVRERAEWLRVAIFGAGAVALERSLARGQLVSVVGRLRTEERLKGPKIIADRVQVLAAGPELAAHDHDGYQGGSYDEEEDTL